MNQYFLTRLIVTGSLIIMPGFVLAHEAGGHNGPGIEFIYRIFHALAGYELFYLGFVFIIAVVLHGIVKDQRGF
jgi:hypothetical protein